VLQPLLNVVAQVQAQHTPASGAECLKIPQCLRLLQRGKAKGFARDGQVLRGICGKHEQHSAGRSTFVELSGRMQVARTIAKCGGYFAAVAQRQAQDEQHLMAFGRALYVWQEGQVIRRRHGLNKRPEQGTHGAILAEGFGAIHRNAVLCEHRPVVTKRAVELPGLQ
jgi:hypothetical protein